MIRFIQPSKEPSCRKFFRLENTLMNPSCKISSASGRVLEYRIQIPIITDAYFLYNR
jgi:hypothetical protein